MRRKGILLAAAVALAGLVPASPAAAAARPTHVAIVIAGHGVGCVKWHSGITGDEVLNDVATVKYRHTDFLITQIDGTPRNNRADETHYWSYWHNTGSGWRYSTTGASAYLPTAGTVEGWHFINGSPTATPPPDRSYASICHDTVAVAPPPPPSTSVPAPTTSTAAARTSTPSPGPATSAAATHPTARPAARHTRSASANNDRTSPATSAAPAIPATVPSTSARPTALPTLHARSAADQRDEHGSAWPTVLVVAVVLVLGGAAAVVAQRRRRSQHPERAT